MSLNIVTLGRDHRSQFAQDLKLEVIRRRGRMHAANTIDQVKHLETHGVPITAVVRSRVDPADDEVVKYCESRRYPVIQAATVRPADVLPYLDKRVAGGEPVKTTAGAGAGATAGADPNAGSRTNAPREPETETEKAPAAEAAEA